MEMSSNYFPGEVHVAQQSRRDKLRSSSSSSAQQHPDEFQNTNFPNNQLSPVALPSDMLNFAPNPGPFTSVNPNRFVSGFEFKPYGDGSWVGVSSYGGSEYVQNLENLHPSFVSNANPNHGLSLSLSSNQISEIRRLGFKSVESGSGSISSIVNQSKGNLTTHDSVRNLGPLGPFTGYTSILMSSKFMKPAQQLLDEFLSVAGLRYQREEGASKVVGTAVIVDCSNACDSNDLSGGCRNGYGDQSFRPDCHEKKAKLLNIQEEVCKRQKQYHQEIQMVISAFESVPGLASATPYISRSLKAISRHFKCLKSAIADQVKYIKNVLGEDLSSPASFSRGDCTSLRFSENLAKVKSGGFGSTGYQNHIWRPQRGLPERAVSVLRAWLFDHFLHPYPTDTDKQMLASQTGLSRNQVSNWFINARVRVWKPMVEEMHMLETKGVSRTEPNSDNSRMSSTVNKRQQDSDNQPSFQPNSLECSGHSSSTLRSRAHMTAEQFLQKHSGIETHRRHHHQVPTGSLDDGSFVGLLPYQRRGLEMGGIGPVSLTLGLRHGSETTQLQHHFQQQGMHFGGHIHDFSG